MTLLNAIEIISLRKDIAPGLLRVLLQARINSFYRELGGKQEHIDVSALYTAGSAYAEYPTRVINITNVWLNGEAIDRTDAIYDTSGEDITVETA